MIQLYLLAFVRHNNPRVELVLKRDHKLKTREGKVLPRDRITAATLGELQWRPGLHASFDALVPAAGPTWNDAVPYARILIPDLRTTTDQSEIEAENARLADRLQTLRAELPKQRSQLGVLERTLGAALPESASHTLGCLETLSQLENGYAAFYEKAQEVFTSPDRLRDQLHEMERLGALADSAAQIAEVKRYLDALHLRERDENLNLQKHSLLGRITLTNLVAQPHVWSSIQAEFEQFEQRYRSEYQKHHRDVNKELSSLRDALADAPRQLNALRLLNSIPELGSARGSELQAQFAQLLAQLEPCRVGDYLAVSVDSAPVCQGCKRELTYAPPTAAVEGFTRALEQALKERQRDLRSETVRRVLERGKGDALSQVLQAAQAANVTALVEVLDDNIVALIRQLLAQDNIVAAEGDVIQQFLQQYSSLEERDISTAVAAFEQLLRAAFEEAKKKNEGKKTIRLTLKYGMCYT